MTAALHDSHIPAPWAYSLPVLVRHHSRYLVQMIQVMRRPGGQQLRESDRSERWMQTAPGEIFRLQFKSLKRGDILRAQLGKQIQQCAQRLALAFANLAPAVKG